MARQTRVHEFARELGISSAEVLAECKRQGEFVKSASSPLEDAVVARLLDVLWPLPEPSAAERAYAGATVRAFIERPPSLVEPEVARVEAALRNVLPPFREPAAPPEARRQRLGYPPRPTPINRPQPPQAGSPIEALALELARGKHQRAQEYIPALLVWLEKRFTLQDVRVWLGAGLALHEAVLADQCSEAGVLPFDLSRVVAGTGVLARLRRGESAAAVRKRLRESETRSA